MKPTDEVWPPPPTRLAPPAETAVGSDDWLTANDLLTEVTWRDYAGLAVVVFWLLLACFAIIFQHRLPAGAVKNVPHIVRTVLS